MGTPARLRFTGRPGVANLRLVLVWIFNKIGYISLVGIFNKIHYISLLGIFNKIHYVFWERKALAVST
jgi:hypothetical protein